MLKRTFLPFFLGGITLLSWGLTSPTMAKSPELTTELNTELKAEAPFEGCHYKQGKFTLGSTVTQDDGKLYVCVNDFNSGGKYAWRLQPK
ncbi:MAG: hypothetical protein KME21_07485 [Desmonostoc vinosum HA7617-LM4]|jgi:hypothetical protein|nr:hypothetical protein [Desmonostoc vinosum HA7617-LM4]